MYWLALPLFVLTACGVNINAVHPVSTPTLPGSTGYQGGLPVKAQGLNL